MKEKKSLTGKLRSRVAIATIAAVGLASSVAMAQPVGGSGLDLPPFGFGQGSAH